MAMDGDACLVWWGLCDMDGVANAEDEPKQPNKIAKRKKKSLTMLNLDRLPVTGNCINCKCDLDNKFID